MTALTLPDDPASNPRLASISGPHNVAGVHVAGPSALRIGREKVDVEVKPLVVGGWKHGFNPALSIRRSCLTSKAKHDSGDDDGEVLHSTVT